MTPGEDARSEAGKRIGAVRVSYESVTQQISASVLAGRMELPLIIRHNTRERLREAILAHERALKELKVVFQIQEPIPPILEGEAEEA